MTQQPSDGPGPTGNQLHDEAADWFARMRGPEAKLYQASFEAWLARGALHRAAYNRMAEIFAIGKGLQMDGEPQADTAPSKNRTGRRIAQIAALSLVLVALAWLGSAITAKIWPQAGRPSPLLATGNSPMFETRIGEIKRVRLTDGSLITLDTNSLVAVAFSPSSRQVRLVRGRARFDVAHAPRPFQVVAGTGIITAHGTVFDVSKGRHDIIAVRLLRGAVDVRLLPAKGGRSDAKRLMPGQSLAFRSEFLPSAPGSPASGKNWPDALAEFDNSPLGLVVEEANRYTAMPIILEGEGLDKVKISGLFRITDSELLAARIARLLNLDLVRYPGRIVLRRR